MTINHPTPQFYREDIILLDGIWTCNNQEIIVPYPIESKLSNYHYNNETTFTYQKEFEIETDKDVLLHFGAVDQVCKIYLNNCYVGSHEGGYLPFSFDITPYLKQHNILVLEVEDKLNHDYPYGKQRKDHKGMWYTPVSGIWQSVYLEIVPRNRIESIRLTPTMHSIQMHIECNDEYTIAIDNGFIQTYNQKDINIEIDNPHLWNVDDPYLYYFTIATKDDVVHSYFALREVSIKQVGKYQRICLNNKPIFLHGVLDQGYFHDGIYTPREKEEYKRDILRMKELGFNMLRKHIKVEPDIFYYYCDKYGMLVFQDMVNNGDYNFIRDTALPNIGFNKKDRVKTYTKQHEFFIQHSKDTIQTLYNHPCIIGYTIFNEGWGQFNADDIYDILKSLDTTRFFDSTSGWFKQNKSDVESLHVYFRNKILKASTQALVLTECGGYSRYIEGHVYSSKQYGYGKADSEEALMERIQKLYDHVIKSIPLGLNMCVYTQVSDIEDEINGLYTYDRKVCKVNIKQMQKIANELRNAIEI